jgi:predicted MFS family arabinose efflux permease
MSTAPLRLPAFRRLLGSYAVSQLGDWAAEVALAVLVYDLTGNPAAVAATWLVHRCVFGMTAPIVVARLERRGPRRVLPTIALTEGAIFAALALAGRSVGLAGILTLVALDGLLAPAGRALMRSTIVAVTRPAGLLEQGNGLINVVFTTNAMLAAAVGGVLTAAFGTSATLAFDAVTFAAVAGLLARAPLPRTEAAAAAPENALRAAVAYVRSRRPLGLMLGADAVFSVFAFAINPVEVVLVRGTLGAGSTQFGLVLGAWGIGMIAGGAAVGRLRQRFGLPAVLLGSCVVSSIAYLGMGLSATVAEAIAWSALGGLGNGLYGVLFVTAVQQRTSDAFQVRVSGLMEALVTTATGLGFIGGGIVATLAGPRAVYVIAGLGGLAVVATVIARLQRGSLRPAVPAAAA